MSSETKVNFSLPRLNPAFLVAAALLANCSTKNNPCLTKVCPNGPDGDAGAEVCDPNDGLCKCGISAVATSDGGAGVVCTPGTSCDPISQTCVSTACANVSCGDTGTCDPVSGECKCGGVQCPPGGTCDFLSGTCKQQQGPCVTKNCNPGEVCDPADGQCKCTLGGPACGATQLCDTDGGCVDDPCFGLVCTATGAACYNGVCKCGGPNGVECSTPGNSCSPIDNSCGPTASCAITPCLQPGTICNPNDAVGSQCHCGTIGGQVCTKKQYCQVYIVDGGPLAPFQDAGGAAIYGQCRGADTCGSVTCPAFETCDPNNFDPKTLIGKCECGGDPANNIPGQVCAPDQTCIVPYDGGPSQCLENCQPFGPPCTAGLDMDSGAPIPYGCYYYQIAKATVCALPTSDAGFGTSCDSPTACAPFTSSGDLTCVGYVADAGTVVVPPQCIPYCDVFPSGSPTSSPPPDGGTHVCPLGTFCSPLDPGIVAGICEEP